MLTFPLCFLACVCVVVVETSKKGGDLTHVYDAPNFAPTLEQWKDPIAYIESIWSHCDKYGMALIRPPKGWNPPNKLKDDCKFPTSVEKRRTQRKRQEGRGEWSGQLTCVCAVAVLLLCPVVSNTFTV